MSIAERLLRVKPRAGPACERYDRTRQPKGDPDCRLGCKRRHNQIVAAAELINLRASQRIR